MRFHLVAPAGMQISLKELLLILRKRLRHLDHLGELKQKVLKEVRADYLTFLNSGASALSLILRAMQAVSGGDRNEVILPAYTCYSVAAACVRNKLKLRLIDINERTLDFEMEELAAAPSGRVLAGIGCNLFGVLNDWDRMNQIAAAAGYFLIDDGAQSLGCHYGERPSGSLGHAGFYSLGRGKPLTAYSGGIVLTNDRELQRELEAAAAELTKPGLAQELVAYAKLSLYALMLHPRFYWLPASLPFLGIGETVFDPKFAPGKLSTLQLAAASTLIERLATDRASRQRHASYLGEALLSTGRFVIAGWSSERCHPYLRLPVLAPDRRVRDKAIICLRQAGIVATTMYPTSIDQIPGIDLQLVGHGRVYPGAQALVDRLFTLPTHAFLDQLDLDLIIKVVNKL